MGDRKPWLILAGAVVLAAAIITSAFIATRSADRDPPAAAAGKTPYSAEDTHDTPVDGDAAGLDLLCASYCEPLMAQESACPTGTTNLMACGMPLAIGSDNVNAVADGSAVLDRSDPERYEDLDRAIADARDAYDTWSDHSACNLVFDVHDPGLTAIYGTELFVCAAEATTVGYTQATVGAVLRNLSNA